MLMSYHDISYVLHFKFFPKYHLCMTIHFLHATGTLEVIFKGIVQFANIIPYILYI
jgi:hypothetical protein